MVIDFMKRDFFIRIWLSFSHKLNDVTIAFKLSSVVPNTYMGIFIHNLVASINAVTLKVIKMNSA